MRRIAKFEIVSLEQFREAWTDTFGPADEGVIEELYETLKLPARATAGSAGYDFFAPAEIILEPGETAKIPTGIRVWMEPDWIEQRPSKPWVGGSNPFGHIFVS